MRKNLALSLLTLSILWLKATTIESSTKKAVRVDNDYFHSYQEKQGRWIVLNEFGKGLEAYLKEIDTLEFEVKTLNSIPSNESIPRNRPVFFPFGEAYIKQLLAEGKGRDIIISDYRDFVWPVGSVNAKISSKLGMRKNSMHTGIDISCPFKSPIIAAGDGVVISARFDGNYGNVIVIQHELNQLQTVYAHNTYLVVKEGSQVKKGQVIAFSGSTGHSTGPHLHFEVRYQNIFLNPEHYIQTPGDTKLAQAKDN
ncbi:MAG: M23 family metallopeptidase [Leptospiraceae bacterium]|nr:M23 family metallopeptidase [Leptospiraceae bacterium]